MKPNFQTAKYLAAILLSCFFFGVAGLSIASAALPNSTGTVIGGTHYGWLIKQWNSSSLASTTGTVLWQCANYGSNQGYLIPGATNGTENIGNSTNQVGMVYANAYVKNYYFATVNATITVTNGTTIFLTPTAGNITLNIDSPANYTAGCDVKLVGGPSLSATNTVLVVPAAGLVNGAANASYATAYTSVTWVSTGTAFYAH